MTKSKRSSLTLPKVLAVDPGIDRIGIAVMSRDKLIHSECFETNRRDAHSVRLLNIAERIENIIAEHKPNALAIEKLFYNKNVSSALAVAEARGVIICEAERGGLALYEYSPQSVKIAVTGYGNASKNQIKTMVQRLVTLPPRRPSRLDDELDAVALGITHLVTARPV